MSTLTHRLNVPRGHEVPPHALLTLHLEREAQFLRAMELQVLLCAVLLNVLIDFIVLFNVNLYRVTIPLVQNFLLTSKQKFRFGLF